MKRRIEHIRPWRQEIAADLSEQGFELDAKANLVPIFAPRYVVSSPNLDSSIALSIVVQDVDAIVYADSLREYLEKEFLRDSV